MVPRLRTRRWSGVALVGVWCWSTLVGAAPAGAEPPGSPATEDFWTGEASASADTLTVTVSAANAPVGFTAGRSLARYQDRTGSSEARALDLGVLPTLFGGEQCDGSPGLLSATTLPVATRADSSVSGASTSQRAEVRLPGLNGGPAGGPIGTQDATATALPSSMATTESVVLDAFLVRVDGATTEVRTKLEGRVREAHAVMSARKLQVFGGLFTFEGPRWEATTRSGDQQLQSGAFTFERATALGIPRSPDQIQADLAGFKRGLEQLLAPFGVTVELPQVQATEDGVRVTPIGFRVANPPFGSKVLLPFLGRIDPLVQALRQEMVRVDCRNALTLTVADVLLGVASGSGSVNLLAGGVEVSTRAVDFSVPPIEEVPVTEPAPTAEVLGLGADAPMDPLGYDTSFGDLGFEDWGGDVAGFDVPSLSETGVAAPSDRSGTPEEVALPPVSATSYEDSDAGRAAMAVGLLAVLGAVTLSLLDRWRGRAARRTIT